VNVRLVDRLPADTDALGTLVFAGRLDEAGRPADFLAACGFTGELGQTAVLPPDPAGGPARIMVGLGSAEHFDLAALRVAVAAFARAGRRFPHLALTVSTAATGLGGADRGSALAVRTIVEAATLALYEFTPYRSRPPAARPSRLDLMAADDQPGRTALELGTRLADAVVLARDLVNEPGGTLTPTEFAARAGAVATSAGLECTVWDAERIAGERLGGLLGVSRGSTQPPSLVRLAYVPEHPTATIALVGKGVTFDSGGLTLKPAPMMNGMKSDMAGAAAVLAAMSALRDLRCPARVYAYLALTDNMVGGDATRIGDVLRMRNGTTVEVLNTDAEGRLILADALVLAGEDEPDGIVDIATLTDAAPIALGRGMAAVLGRGDDWLRRVQDAAARAGEPTWPLPLRRDCRSILDSKLADLVNHKPGERFAGAIVGALFLAEFVPTDVPWAHIDIGGCALADRDEGELVTGGTGYGVRTLIELCGYGAQTI
jgi:leucyl aminopeptidase